MKFISKNTIQFSLFVLACTLWVGIFFVLSEFIDSPSRGFNGFLIIVGHWGLICMATFFLLYVAAINKYFFSIFFPLFSLLGSILAFYRYAYKATLTPMLIDASLNNDLRTSLDVISAPLIFFVLTCLVISVLLVWFRFKHIVLNNHYGLLFLSLSLLWLIFSVNGRAKNSIFQRFPFSIYYNFSEYNKLQTQIATSRINPDPTLNVENTDSLIVILVLGESLRADHLSLNGYNRQTNPRLSLRKNIFSLPHVFSEYTNTNRSLPHLLTRADSVHTEFAFTETSFISLFKQCGFNTAWISNQDPGYTYVGFMKECDTIMYCHPEKSVYNYNEWLDEDLLPLTKKNIDNGSIQKLIILHTIGSHWYYNNHYSKKFEKFKPVTSSRIIAQCTPEEIVNSYDNTVLYTDFFLDELIEQLEKKNAILIYLSDHGETLGEDGAWLHASDNTASKNPACIIWYSDNYKNKNHDNIEALTKNRNKHLRTDFLYHSILDASNIPSKTIRKEMNIFYECK